MKKQSIFLAIMIFISLFGVRQTVVEDTKNDSHISLSKSYLKKFLDKDSIFFGASALAEENVKFFETNVAVEEFAKKESYLVKPGDTLIGIGKKISVNWKTLAKRNNLEPPYKIRDGRRLVYESSDVKVQEKIEAKREEKKRDITPDSLGATTSEGQMEEDWKKQALIPRKEYPDEKYSQDMELPKEAVVPADSSKEGVVRTIKPKIIQPIKKPRNEVAVKYAEKFEKKCGHVRDVYCDFLCDRSRFNRILNLFGLVDVEKEELRKRIMSGDFHWGLARKGDRFDMGLSGRNLIDLRSVELYPEIDWSCRKTDLAAADVYRISSGKEIWIFLQEGDIYLLKTRNSKIFLKGPVSMEPPFKEKALDKMKDEIRDRYFKLSPSPGRDGLDDGSRCSSSVNRDYPESQGLMNQVAVSPGKMIDQWRNSSHKQPSVVRVGHANNEQAEEIHIEPKPLDESRITGFPERYDQKTSRSKAQKWTGGVAVSPGRIQIE